MPIEISKSVSAFEGTFCHGAFDGSVVRFDVFAIALGQCPFRSSADAKLEMGTWLRLT